MPRTRPSGNLVFLLLRSLDSATSPNRRLQRYDWRFQHTKWANVGSQGSGWLDFRDALAPWHSNPGKRTFELFSSPF
jgi:hypothetical protein